MAKFNPIKPPSPIEIDKFLGLNESVGETEIKVGEAVTQVNFRLTQDYKPEKREGHSKFIDFGSSNVQGIWQGSINKTFTITNELTNSDFSSGTTGWTPVGATLSAASNVLSITGNGSNASAVVYQNTAAVQINNDFYVYAKARVTNSDCTRIRIAVVGSTGGTDEFVYILNTPTINQWYQIYIKTKPPSNATGNLLVVFRHEYADAATANGKVMELKETILSDMTDGEHDVVDTATMLTYSDPHFTTTAVGSVSKNILIALNGGTAYEYNLDDANTDTAIADLLADETVLELGTITDALTSIFWFESELYFINGTDYKVYNGVYFTDVVGYIPTIAIETPPAGGGTDYEQVNLLTGSKKQEFVGDGASTDYQLRQTAITSVDAVVVDGVTKTVTTHYTVNLTTGVVTFTAGNIPATDAEVIITWTKVTAGNAALVTGNKYAMDFGPSNDTAIFLWGHGTYKNKVVWCGALDASYFPEFNFNLIGSDQFAITDITAQYNRQVIHKQNRTFYSYADYNSVTGVYDYPVFDLNETVGCETFNGVELIDNNPVSLFKNYIWEWKSTQVESELNVERISERIWKSLDAEDITTAVTFDYQSKKELWVNIGSTVYIWNYGNDTFYKYDNIAGTCFLEIDGVVYYGGSGTVEKFGGFTDNGTAVTATLELGFTDFGAMHLRKNSRVMWVAIQPYTRTGVDISYITNRMPYDSYKEISKRIEYRIFDFSDFDFSDFSFKTNINPTTFRRKIRAKKYTFIKFRFQNSENNEYLVMLGVKIMAETMGEAKE